LPRLRDDRYLALHHGGAARAVPQDPRTDTE
jgi:hypothetical protein